MLFKYFDVDDSNYITKDNVKAAMKKLGKIITEEEL